MYYYVKTCQDLYLVKYCLNRATGYHTYYLTNNIKEAGLFFPDQFNHILKILQTNIYIGKVNSNGDPVTYTML